jgi:hypothetical protein
MLSRVLKQSSDSSSIGDGMKLKMTVLLSFIKSYLDGDESSDEDDAKHWIFIIINSVRTYFH